MIDSVIYQGIKAALEDFPGADGDFNNRVWARGQLGKNGVPASPPVPYVMYGMGQVLPGPAKDSSPDTSTCPVSVLVYDQPGSFVRIKNIHKVIRHTLVALVGQQGPEETQLTGCDWLGEGDDLYDQVTDRNVKQANFRIAAQM